MSLVFLTLWYYTNGLNLGLFPEKPGLYILEVS